jgi:hypothetical protein
MEAPHPSRIPRGARDQVKVMAGPLPWWRSPILLNSLARRSTNVIGSGSSIRTDSNVFAANARLPILIRGVPEDDRYLVVQVHHGTDPRNRVFVRDLEGGVTGAPMVELLAEGDAAYEFIGNDGSRFFFITDADAERRRIVAQGNPLQRAKGIACR